MLSQLMKYFLIFIMRPAKKQRIRDAREAERLRQIRLLTTSNLERRREADGTMIGDDDDDGGYYF
jgi:hypothetical protein